MDIYSFFNSKDIGDHLKKIEYSFSPVETAWLIWQNQRMSLEEKHALWQELIDTTSDCMMRHRRHQTTWSLHQFLRDHIKYQRDLMDEFHREDPDWVYQYSRFDAESLNWWPATSVFSSFSKCCVCLGHGLVEYDAAFYPGILKTVRKMHLDKGGERSHEEFYTAKLAQGKLMSLYYIGDKESSSFNYPYDFEDMGFSFPLPFEKGDIVWIPKSGKGLFVIDQIGLKGKPYTEPLSGVFGFGDYTDMNVKGYFADSENGVVYDTVWNCMDCEYSKDDLMGSQRILIPVGAYLKGEISLDLLLQTVHWMLLDDHAAAGIPSGYTAEALQLAGAGDAHERRERILKCRQKRKERK